MKQQTNKKASRRQAPHPRTVSGRLQRQRTRANIIEVAINVFAKHGANAPVIDDFVKAAGVSRGTFYNYFSTVQELLETAVGLVANSYIDVIGPLIDDIANPVIRYACASRLFQRRAQADPLFAEFVVSISMVASRIDRRLHQDIQAAIRQGLVQVHSVDAAIIAAAGIGQYSVGHMTARRHRERVPDIEIVRLVLAAWGVNKSLIKRALTAPLPRIEFVPLPRHQLRAR